MNAMISGSHNAVVEDIAAMGWAALSADELVDVAWAYYFFSVQFRESLMAARALFPDDEYLKTLAREECHTSNLSPWPGVASPGEKMNHDEFMRRVLSREPVSPERRARLEGIGKAYLHTTRGLSRQAQALSISSYEDGGLEAVFRAFLTAPQWDGSLLQGFRHFLTEHIRFDSDPDAGHGALSRHLPPDESVVALWVAFRDLLLQAVPTLSPQSV